MFILSSFSSDPFAKLNPSRRIRGGSANLLDYIPLLRVFPSKAKTAALEGFKEREECIERIFQAMKDDVDLGKAPNCIGATLMTDKDSKLSHGENEAALSTVVP